MKTVYLLSTIMAPEFSQGTITVRPLTKDEFVKKLRTVKKNYCGHPVTIGVLQEMFPELPQSERGFWNGDGICLAARPKGGVRGSQQGDTMVTINDLEFAEFQWTTNKEE